MTFEKTVRISGRDLVDLHLTASTPASIPDDERAAIAARAYPLMDDEYDMRVVTELYWKRFATAREPKRCLTQERCQTPALSLRRAAAEGV